MEKFKTLQSSCVPIKLENIDTDQIIPARFLKAINKIGFGDHLFRDWRYDENNNPKKDFVLNNNTYSGEILVAAKNFGCGSSREHAAWAIVGYGFKAVISSFFADIFKNNSLNNGLLPVQVSDAFLSKIFESIDRVPKAEIKIDLPDQTITIVASGDSEKFEISNYKKISLIEGLDDIDFLINKKEKIVQFEKTHMMY